VLSDLTYDKRTHAATLCPVIEPVTQPVGIKAKTSPPFFFDRFNPESKAGGSSRFRHLENVRFRLFAKRGFQHGCQALLSLRNPSSIVLSDHLFRSCPGVRRHLARSRPDVAAGCAKTYAETVRSWLLLPWAAKRPQLVQLASPDISYDIHVGGCVVPEDVRTDLISSGANAFLQPLGNPCINMCAGLRCSDLDFSSRLKAVDMECAYVRNAKAGCKTRRR